MVYVPGNLTLIHSSNGFGLYRYDSTDADDVVDAGGYFNNDDDDLILRVGDIIEVFSWTTAVRTGTVNDVSRVVVLTVDSAGAVNVSDDIYVTGIVSSSD